MSGEPARKSLTGRRAFVYARISAAAHALEPVVFGLTLAGGIYLATHQAGDLVLRDRRGAASSELVVPGLLLLGGVTMVAASLLFFHRKGRRLRQRLLAAAAAALFFGLGYRAELGSRRSGAFFGLTTLPPAARFVEDDPARPKVEYVLNSWGLRGADFREGKPEGARRIAVVGDSFVFGSGVEEADSLPVRLGARLRERFPGSSLEVLNLGVPGNNLVSHLATARLAEERLGADVVVLCLTLPDDLSSWDGQAERRDHERIGGFSFASYMLGYGAAITLWGERNLARDLTDEGVAFLGAEAARFAAARGPASRPLAVFAYSFEDPRVSSILRSIPAAALVPPVRFDPSHYIPGDGHPTAAGNDAFSRRIASAFEPAWVGAR